MLSEKESPSRILRRKVKCPRKWHGRVGFLVVVLALIAPALLPADRALAAEASQALAECGPDRPAGTDCNPQIGDVGVTTTDRDAPLDDTPEHTIRAEDLPVDAIRKIVHDYLIDHPEVLLEAQQALQARHEAQAAERARVAITANSEEPYNDAEAPVGGNPDGKITLVEFFDYRCRYCRNVRSVLDDITASNTDLRIIYKEFPILGPESLLAAQAALAARAQGKYLAFHEALMVAEGRFDRAHVLAVAVSVGLDPDKLSHDMGDPAIAHLIEKNHRLARALGVTSTPSFVLGLRLIRGALSLDHFENMIAEARIAAGPEPKN